MQVALLGLPLMGRILADKLLADGHEVVAWDNAKEALEQIRTDKAEFVVNQKLTIIHTLEELRTILRKPRVFLLMQKPGEPTESLLSQLNNFMEAGDVVMDGANSFFKDTNRRYEDYEKRGIKFLGVGIAGGINVLENGCSLMVGGSNDAYQYMIPVLDSLAKPNSVHAYFGTGGAGHYVKMVHDGIELGMSQAIAEGMTVLSKSGYQLDPKDAVYTWQQGGTISSFMLDMVTDVLSTDPSLSQYDGSMNIPSSAGDAAATAKESGVQIPVTNQALDFQKRAQYDKLIQETFTAKMVQAMRKEWDGEEVKPVVQQASDINSQS